MVATSTFLCGYWTGSRYCTKYCVLTIIWQKTIIWGPFYGFKSKRLYRMNLTRGNTDNISHVAILTWPGMTSSLTWKVSRANQCFGKLPFISINVFFRITVSLKTFPWIFHHPNFIKNTSAFDVSNGVNIRFVHRVLYVQFAFQVSL